jgi:HK97 family phage prohead protease
MSIKIKTLCHGGIVTETKEVERNGVKVGIIEGYGATWDVDRGGWDGVKDQFIRGAFTKAIQRHKETNRQVRFKDHHGRTIGGIPIESVKQDDRGVFISAEVNLEIQQGKDAFSLAKQGVLTDFSIGWGLGEGSSVKDGVRSIPESEMWEFSIVDEPMNSKANITAVKAVDFSTLADVEIRELERAMKEGIKFDNKEAKQIISLMKSAGMLRDEHDDSRDGDEKAIVQKLDEILNTIKE